MKRKSNLKRKTRRNYRTRKYLAYGGQVPAPANMFRNFSNNEVYTSLNNFLQAAYSVKLAAESILSTSLNQNNYTDDPNSESRGTRYLQIDSAGSFSSATSTIQFSLDNLYRTLTGSTTGPPLPGPMAAPPSPWNPPPLSFN